MRERDTNRGLSAGPNVYVARQDYCSLFVSLAGTPPAIRRQYTPNQREPLGLLFAAAAPSRSSLFFSVDRIVRGKAREKASAGKRGLVDATSGREKTRPPTTHGRRTHTHTKIEMIDHVISNSDTCICGVACCAAFGTGSPQKPSPVVAGAPVATLAERANRHGPTKPPRKNDRGAKSSAESGTRRLRSAPKRHLQNVDCLPQGVNGGRPELTPRADPTPQLTSARLDQQEKKRWPPSAVEPYSD